MYFFLFFLLFKNGKGECKIFSNFDILLCSLEEREKREREDNILLFKIVRSKYLIIYRVIVFKVIG